MLPASRQLCVACVTNRASAFNIEIVSDVPLTICLFGLICFDDITLLFATVRRLQQYRTLVVNVYMTLLSYNCHHRVRIQFG